MLDYRPGTSIRSHCDEHRVELAGDVALEAADDLAFGESFVGPAFYVGAGGFVVSQSHDGDDVEGAVGLSVAAAG